VKCAGFARIALLFQTKGRINLLLRNGGLRLANCNFSACNEVRRRDSGERWACSRYSIDYFMDQRG
jgi:hypothetical protein